MAEFDTHYVPETRLRWNASPPNQLSAVHYMLVADQYGSCYSAHPDVNYRRNNIIRQARVCKYFFSVDGFIADVHESFRRYNYSCQTAELLYIRDHALFPRCRIGLRTRHIKSWISSVCDGLDTQKPLLIPQIDSNRSCPRVRYYSPIALFRTFSHYNRPGPAHA